MSRTTFQNSHARLPISDCMNLLNSCSAPSIVLPTQPRFSVRYRRVQNCCIQNICRWLHGFGTVSKTTQSCVTTTIILNCHTYLQPLSQKFSHVWQLLGYSSSPSNSIQGILYHNSVPINESSWYWNSRRWMSHLSRFDPQHVSFWVVSHSSRHQASVVEITQIVHRVCVSWNSKSFCVPKGYYYNIIEVFFSNTHLLQTKLPWKSRTFISQF